MSQVLVVCGGNINRSAAAHAVLAKLGVDVTSGAMAVKLRDRVPVRTVAYMLELGYDLSGHAPRHVTDEMLERAEIILYMDGDEKRRGLGDLLRRARRANRVAEWTPKFYPLAKFIGKERIGDPSRHYKTHPEFKQAFQDVLTACVAFAKWWPENREEFLQGVRDKVQQSPRSSTKVMRY